MKVKLSSSKFLSGLNLTENREMMIIVVKVYRTKY